MEDYTLNIDLSHGSDAYDLAMQIMQLLYNEYKSANAVAKGDNGGLLSYFNPNGQHWHIEWKKDKQSLVMWMEVPPYWQAIDEGRRPTQRGGNGALLPAIKQWIRLKGITPKQPKRIGKKKQKRITNDQLAYLITRKIHRRGFFDPNHHGKHCFSIALQKATSTGVIAELSHSIHDDLGREVHVTLSEIVSAV